MAKKLKAAQAKSLAYSLFMMDDLSFVEIAERVGYTSAAVGNWAREGSWKDLKEALNSTSENQLKNFASQLNELNTEISGRDPGKRYPGPGEADTQIKLAKAILMFKGDADLTELLAYNRLFLKFLRSRHPDKLKEYTLLHDEFIKERI